MKKTGSGWLDKRIKEAFELREQIIFLRSQLKIYQSSPLRMFLVRDGRSANKNAKRLWPDERHTAKKNPFRSCDYPDYGTAEYKRMTSKKYRMRRLEKRLKLWGRKIEALIRELCRYKKPKVRRIKPRKPTPRKMTDIQLQVFASYMRNHGNISSVAKELGKDRKTIRQHLIAIKKKTPDLDKAEKLFHTPKPKTYSLDMDVSDDIDFRR